eukprot:1159023-Pelagomonas_calceolata.AAC.3
MTWGKGHGIGKWTRDMTRDMTWKKGYDKGKGRAPEAEHALQSSSAPPRIHQRQGLEVFCGVTFASKCRTTFRQIKVQARNMLAGVCNAHTIFTEHMLRVLRQRNPWPSGVLEDGAAKISGQRSSTHTGPRIEAVPFLCIDVANASTEVVRQCLSYAVMLLIPAQRL